MLNAPPPVVPCSAFERTALVDMMTGAQPLLA